LAHGGHSGVHQDPAGRHARVAGHAHRIHHSQFPDLFTPQYIEFHGDLNLMKAGIAFASRLNTVSPRYAQEIQTARYGEGLDGFLRTRSASLSGILNGVDYSLWSPAEDCYAARKYSARNLSGKKACKKMLQRLVGFPERDAPLFGMISRLYWQKGVDLLIGAIEELARLDIQIVILGKGDPYYERSLSEAVDKFPDRFRLSLAFDQMMSHQIEAGSDFFLMPSHYEPCGLSQLYSLAYGTVPIVRETGGLADSVRPISKANLRKKTATGIVFQDETPEALVEAVRQGIALFNDPKTLHVVRTTGMKEDFSWDRSSKEYVKLYMQAIARP
jgi:starch synthase